MDSLEHRVSVFFDENSDESDRSLNYESDDDNDVVSHAAQPKMSKRTLFWESQQALLQEVLERYSLTGRKLRQEVSEIIDKAREAADADPCPCPKPNTDASCNLCFRLTLVNLLSHNGFNATLRRSKWRHTTKLPAGTHEYIEVMASTASRTKQIPYIVEVEFRDQFEIAKACNEYKELVSLLPEYYIGKLDCLNAIVGIVCDAAKQSMKESRIHMAPWRKRRFMLMKWSASISVEQSATTTFKRYRSSQPSRGAQGCCLQFSAASTVVVT